MKTVTSPLYKLLSVLMLGISIPNLLYTQFEHYLSTQITESNEIIIQANESPILIISFYNDLVENKNGDLTQIVNENYYIEQDIRAQKFTLKDSQNIYQVVKASDNNTYISTTVKNALFQQRIRVGKEYENTEVSQYYPGIYVSNGLVNKIDHDTELKIIQLPLSSNTSCKLQINYTDDFKYESPQYNTLIFETKDNNIDFYVSYKCK